MNDLIIAPPVCSSRDASRHPSDQSCPQGGTSLTRDSLPLASLATAPAGSVSAVARRLINNRLAVVGLLVAVGPVGLAALWLSPRFSNPTKVIVTIGYFGLTVLAPLIVTWYWLDIAIRPLLEVFPK